MRRTRSEYLLYIAEIRLNNNSDRSYIPVTDTDIKIGRDGPIKIH